jgi:hypothetical protein
MKNVITRIAFHMSVTYVNFCQECLLRGEIVTTNHYHPLGGKTRGQDQQFITAKNNYLH